MDHDDGPKVNFEAMFADWMKSVSGFWLAASRAWPAGASDSQDGSKSSGRTFPDWMQEAWQTFLKNWQTAFSAFSSTQSLEAVFKAAGTYPEIAAKILGTAWEGYFKLYQMWLKSAAEAGKTSEAYSYEGLRPDTFEGWLEFYRKEFQPYLKMPQVGLTRFYQERANEALDKFSEFQLVLAEFIHLLQLPVEKSLRAMQEKIEEQSQSGNLSADFKDYYNLWIKILEGHYMTLYQSPEWVRLLARTLHAADEFKGARDRVLMDLLQFFPVPTTRDMDELYREFYELKKTVKSMAERLQRLESPT